MQALKLIVDTLTTAVDRKEARGRKSDDHGENTSDIRITVPEFLIDIFPLEDCSKYFTTPSRSTPAHDLVL